MATNDVSLKEGSSKPKISLSFELTRSGLVQLNKAEAKVDELYIVEEKPKKVKKESASNATKNSTEEETISDKQEQTDSEEK